MAPATPPQSRIPPSPAARKPYSAPASGPCRRRASRAAGVVFSDLLLYPDLITLAGDTGIQWCERTWNTTRGCWPRGPECDHCYAETLAGRFCGPGLPYEGIAHKVDGESRWTGRVQLLPHKLREPQSVRRPTVWFVDSMSDLFYRHPQARQLGGGFEVPDHWIDEVFAVMAACPQHLFLVLTKYVDRAAEWFRDPARAEVQRCVHLKDAPPFPGWPLPNVWISFSTGTQRTHNLWHPHFQRIPVAVKFASLEPLLGTMDLSRSLPWLDWGIVGGESGPRKTGRLCEPESLDGVIEQFARAEKPLFVKQAGTVLAQRYGWKGKGGNPYDCPERWRRRQMPRALHEWVKAREKGMESL